MGPPKIWLPAKLETVPCKPQTVGSWVPRSHGSALSPQWVEQDGPNMARPG